MHGPSDTTFSFVTIHGNAKLIAYKLREELVMDTNKDLLKELNEKKLIFEFLSILKINKISHGGQNPLNTS